MERSPLDDPAARPFVECDGCGVVLPEAEAHVLRGDLGQVVRAVVIQAICDDCWPDAEAPE